MSVEIAEPVFAQSRGKNKLHEWQKHLNFKTQIYFKFEFSKESASYSELTIAIYLINVLKMSLNKAEPETTLSRFKNN
jgi:hypothetical protein